MKKRRLRADLLVLCLAASLVGIAGASEPSPEALTPLEVQYFGKPFPADPTEQRVTRLEHRLNQTPPPASSLGYRVNNLYGVNHRIVTPSEKRAAIVAYNQGVDDARSGKTPAAIAAFQSALKHDPTMIQAYNNLGDLYLKEAQYTQAIQTFQKALEFTPKEPLLHRNIGVTYEKLGQIEEAIHAYRMYLQYAPTPDLAIQSIVRNYEKNHVAGQLSNNYVAFASHATNGRKLLWPESLVPIPVYLQTATREQAYFIPALYEAFQKWEKATHGRIRFREVNNPKEARLKVLLTVGPLTHPYMDVAHTSYTYSESVVAGMKDMHMLMNVNTGDAQTMTPLPERFAQVHRLALHEVGHAIGIWGHSVDPKDIMYTHPIVSDLSVRDVETIRTLYDLH